MAALALLTACQSTPALAQSAVTWSSVAPATSGTVGGTGTWDTSTLNWWNGTTGATWSNAANDTAVFAGTSGTVALGGNITAGGLTFNTTGYLINAGANTLTLGAATNTLSLNNVASGTISGLVAGTGNVRLDQGRLAGVGTAGTLNLIGTATGGWSGTTTITQGQTLSLGGANQALLNTSAINLNRGTITLANTSTAEAALNRMSNTAAINVSGGGGFTWTNTAAASRTYAETIGAVSVANGEFVVTLSTTTHATGTQSLTLGGLTRSGSTASVRFVSSTALNATNARVIVAGAAATPANQIIGPWATAGGDYAIFDSGSNVIAANISASNESAWTGGSTIAYTASSSQILTATRTIAALRYSGTLAAGTSGTALTVDTNANLETYGILAVAPTGTSSTLSIMANGSGVITTPTGGGNLFLATNFANSSNSSNFFSIDAPITDNAGAVTVVKTGQGVLRLQGTNTFTGGLVANAGRLVIASDAALGATNGSVTINGNVQVVLPSSGTVGTGRTFTVNDGAVLALSTNSSTLAANVTGAGGVSFAGSAGSSVFTLSGAANTFTGPVSVAQGTLVAASLADGVGVGPVFLPGGSGGVTTFRWTGGTQTFNNREFVLGTTNAANVGAIQNFGSGALTVTRDLGFAGTVAARALTLSGTSTGFSNEFSGKLADPAGGVLNLTKADAGTWILSAANTYTGTTTLTAGELAISSDANLSGTASPLVFNGGTLKILGTSLTSLNTNRSGTFTAATNVGFNIDAASNTFTVSQSLNQTTGGLTKTGPGTLYLTGSNSYTGVTTASGGTLRLAGVNQIADTGTVAIAGGAVHLEASETIGRLNVTSSGTLTAAAGATLTSGSYTVSNPAGSSVALAANLAGSGGMTISGSGNVALPGNISLSGSLGISGPATIDISGSNSFAGGVTINNGSGNALIILGGNNVLGTGTVFLGTNVADNPTFRATTNVTLPNNFRPLTPGVSKYNMFNVDGSYSITLTGTVVNNQPTTPSLTNNLSAGALLTVNEFVSEDAAGRVYISGAGNTNIGRTTVGYTSGTTVMKQYVQIVGSGTTTITDTFGVNASSSVGGTARLVIGPSAIMVSQTNGVNLSSFNNTLDGVLGSSPTFEYASNLDSTITAQVRDSLQVLKTGNGVLTLSGANTFTGGLTLSAGQINANHIYALGNAASTVTITSGTLDSTGTNAIILTQNQPQAWNGPFTFVGTQSLNLGTGTVTLGVSPVVTVQSSTLTVGGPITGGFGLTKSGPGTLRLNGAGTFTGDTLVSSGTLMLGSNLALQMSGFDTSSAGVLATSGTAITAPAFGGLIGSTDLASEFATGYGNFSSLTLNPQAGKTYTYSGVIANGTSAGTSLTKSGPGTQVLSGLNTYTGKTTIGDGTLEVASIGAANNPGPLGQNATIDLGAGATSGTLRWVGGTDTTVSRTFNLSGTAGGGGTIVADGSGTLTIASVTALAGAAKTLTFTGTNLGINTVSAAIPNAASDATVSVVKDGPGLWRFTGSSSGFSGGLTVKNGTVLAAGSAPLGSSSILGTAAPVVGDTDLGATGTAALLFEAGATVGRNVTVASGPSGQAVLIGGASTSGTVEFSNGPNLSIGRNVSLVATGGGQVNFSSNWVGASGSGSIPTHDVSIGAAGYDGTVRLLTTSSTLRTDGAIAVRNGRAILGPGTTLDGAGTLAIDAGATLAGIGTVASPLGGAGLVAPGNSPGILTAEAVEASGGLDWAFEFEGASPTYTSSSASVNDILRLTGTSPFLGGSLSSANVVSLYLPASAATGGTFTGGFFTDMTAAAFTNFSTTIGSGSFVAYYESGTSGAYSYGGKNYSLLSDLGHQLSVNTTTVSGTTNFQTGGAVADGQVSTFTVVVPEPAALALAGIGIAAAAWALRRRRPL